jgi:dipeptidyl aminopeptidase/acylaminoacyl peptidase
MLKRFLVGLAALAAAVSPAQAKPPLEAFGDMPEIRAVEIAPDGKRVAYLQRKDGADILVVHEFATGASKALAKVTEIRARDVHFAGNDYVVLVASRDKKTIGVSGRYEYSAAFAFNLKTGRFVQLLRDTDEIYPAQSGLGQIVGMDPSGQAVLMPAYMGVGRVDPSFDLLRVPLETGRGLRGGGTKGTQTAIDWLVNKNGVAIAREEFSTKNQVHEINVRDGDGSPWRRIYQNAAPLPAISMVGASADGKSLYVIDARESEFMSLHSMSTVDGTISSSLMERNDAEVADVVADLNRVVHGVRYSGMLPTYDMFDAAVEADIRGVQSALQGAAVYLDSWSSDWSKLLFFAEGGKGGERYVMLDRTTKKLSNVANARPDITSADVGEVMTIEYKARDGLKIPALITWPANVAEAQRTKLPLVVLPHGGPESYDSVGFDWLAQFLANEGYVVLQPNFRGSAGFGEAFAAAGRGEWGRKMQDDITDGVNAMVKTGWADPARTCIVGWSYGGYAALAAGATTPDAYKCVASIAGVSNLREMMSDDRRLYGERSRTVTYWESLIGDPDKDGAAIDAVSPALNAGKFKAPVLLIHGAADTVVPVRQSDMMNDALKNAQKTVQYIRINGDDHSLVDNDSRRTVLTALGEFLTKHIGSKQ